MVVTHIGHAHSSESVALVGNFFKELIYGCKSFKFKGKINDFIKLCFFGASRKLITIAGYALFRCIRYVSCWSVKRIWQNMKFSFTTFRKNCVCLALYSWNFHSSKAINFYPFPRPSTTRSSWQRVGAKLSLTEGEMRCRINSVIQCSRFTEVKRGATLTR